MPPLSPRNAQSPVAHISSRLYSHRDSRTKKTLYTSELIKFWNNTFTICHSETVENSETKENGRQHKHRRTSATTQGPSPTRGGSGVNTGWQAPVVQECWKGCGAGENPSRFSPYLVFFSKKRGIKSRELELYRPYWDFLQIIQIHQESLSLPYLQLFALTLR